MPIFQAFGGNNNQKNPQTDARKSRVGAVLRYTMMPEILPRIRALGLHFGHFAYLLALVFSSARLISRNHPVMNPANIGQFGVRQVVAIAANNITWSKNNIDQIAIFAAIVIGLIMIVIQAGLIALAALTGFGNEAQAQGFFTTPNPDKDPIMILFANVFGDLNGFWGAGVIANAPNSGNIIHDVVYSMLASYSTAMMVIAVIIVIYYLMAVVAEAAKDGTPFGKRFNSLWAPIRLVVALGLLVPLGSGLNSAQYLTLWIAKMGSGMATQMWSLALSKMDASDSQRYIIDDFKTDWVHDFAFRVFLMEVCTQGNNKYDNWGPASTEYIKGTETLKKKNGYFSYKLSYTNLSLNNNCGTLEVAMKEEKPESLMSADKVIPTEDIFDASQKAIHKLATSPAITQAAADYVGYTISVNGRSRAMSEADIDKLLIKVNDEATKIKEELFQDIENVAKFRFSDEIAAFIDQKKDSWAYAGTYYLEIARIIQASHDNKMGAIPNTAGVELSGEMAANGKAGWLGFLIVGSNDEVNIALKLMQNRYNSTKDQYVVLDEPPNECEGISDSSPFLRRVGCAAFAILVPDELTELANDKTKNVDPLSALIQAGHNIVNRSWEVLLASLSSSALSFIPVVGGLLSTASSVLTMIAVFGLAAGITLYFILPLLPFMYFFFAIASWVMEIFEAIIAMPLWALAHLKIEGDGLPGQAAVNGYYLLFAIFLRPAMIVLGLVCGMIVFSGLVFLLQSLWSDVLYVKGVSSLSGFEVLVYTIIFAYFCYVAAVTSFKLVDQIPNQILRWIGSNPGTFSDNKEDPTHGSNNLLTAGAGFFANQGFQSINNGLSAFGKNLRDKRNQSNNP